MFCNNLIFFTKKFDNPVSEYIIPYLNFPISKMSFCYFQVFVATSIRNENNRDDTIVALNWVSNKLYSVMIKKFCKDLKRDLFWRFSKIYDIHDVFLITEGCFKIMTLDCE